MSQGSNSGPYAYTALYPGLPHLPTPNYTKCLPFSLFSQAVPFHFSYKTICDSVHSCLLGVLLLVNRTFLVETLQLRDLEAT